MYFFSEMLGHISEVYVMVICLIKISVFMQKLIKFP